MQEVMDLASRIAPLPTRMWYAEDDQYGSATSWGFANTKYAIAFVSKAERDEYVLSTGRLTTRQISAQRAYELMGRSGNNRSFHLVKDNAEYYVWEHCLERGLVTERYMERIGVHA